MMRKMALRAEDFRELEMFAEGKKYVDISRELGVKSSKGRVTEAFFRVVNFGCQ